METALFAFLPGALLMIFRAGGMILGLPVLGRRGDSRWPRMVLAVGMGALLYLPNPVIVPLPPNFFVFAVMAVREVLVGLLLGMGLNTLFGTLVVAGEIIGQNMGLNMSRAVDPDTGDQGVVLSKFLETMGLILFFKLNGHLLVFRILAVVNGVLPLGAPFDPARAMKGFTALTEAVFSNAMSLAAPVFAVMLLMMLTLLVVGRAVQQINLMEFAFALQIVIGLMGCVVFIPRVLPHVEEILEQIAGAVVRLAAPF